MSDRLKLVSLTANEKLTDEIAEILGVEKPEEMTGTSILKH